MGPLLHEKSRCEMCMRAILLLYFACHPCSSALRPSSARRRLCTTTNVLTPLLRNNATSCLNVISKSRFASSSQIVEDSKSGILCEIEFSILDHIPSALPRISIPVTSAQSRILDASFGAMDLQASHTHLTAVLWQRASGATWLHLLYCFQSNHENHERNVAWEEVLYFALR